LGLGGIALRSSRNPGRGLKHEERCRGAGLGVLVNTYAIHGIGKEEKSNDGRGVV
jgi:hypothetical protein